MTDDLARLDAVAQAELVRSGEASPLELVDAAIARIESLDPQVNAVIHPRFERAREEAASARARSKRSWMTALSCGSSASIRAMAASTSSTGDASPRRTSTVS